MKAQLTIVVLAVAFASMGCEGQKTWTAVEAERRRISTEAKRLVPKEQWDTFDTIVFDRPREKPESNVTGYDHAVTRVNREIVAVSEEAEKVRELGLAINEKRFYPMDKADGILASRKSDLAAWQIHVANARKMLLVAEAAQAQDVWLPMLDQIIHESLPLSPQRTARTIPESQKLQLSRAKEWFQLWQSKWMAVQP